MKKIVSLMGASALALTLAACSGGSNNDEAAATPVETNVEELAPVSEEPNIAVPVEAPAPEPTPTPAPAPTGKEFDSSTTQEDAEATGMTSRVSRDEDDGSAPVQ